MKILALILVSLLCLASIASAEKDSIIVGGQFNNMSLGVPYKVSFDLGVPKNSYSRNVIGVTREAVTGLGGGNRTTFYISISNKTSDATIALEEYDRDQPIVSNELLQRYLIPDIRYALLFGTPFKDSAFNNATLLSIDNTTGAFTSISSSPPESNIYFAKYVPISDPTRVHVLIESLYPWNFGTQQLLKTIHVEKVANSTGT